MTLRGMPYFLLPPNMHSIFGFKVKLMDDSLELVELELEGTENCILGPGLEKSCSGTRSINQLRHAELQVKAIPYNRRNNGKTVLTSESFDNE